MPINRKNEKECNKESTETEERFYGNENAWVSTSSVAMSRILPRHMRLTEREKLWESANNYKWTSTMFNTVIHEPVWWPKNHNITAAQQTRLARSNFLLDPHRGNLNWVLEFEKRPPQKERERYSGPQDHPIQEPRNKKIWSEKEIERGGNTQEAATSGSRKSRTQQLKGFGGN